MLTQLYEKTGREIYTKLDEVKSSRSIETRYCLRSVLVAIRHICFLREDDVMDLVLEKDRMPEGLSLNQKFTKIQLSKGSGYDNSSLTVVGHLETIASKIYDAAKGN